jgi:glyoxylase-like metal-dependent hydrolase (beta-lactamase superfamily II)
MKLGAFEIFPVRDGRFRLDGGAMFGVVPRVLWEQCCPPDEKNRIPLSLTCLLIRAHRKHILVDTGLGGKDDAAFQSRFAVERTPTLPESVQRLGLSVDDVDLVINTHLHFDHAGGNTLREDGRIRPVFRKARYVVQRGEYDDALRPNERTRASYQRENVAVGELQHQWELLEGDAELLPGVSVLVTGGHTRHHQCVKVESEGQVALFLGDLIPTVAHLPLPYIMGYDLYPLDTLEQKRRLLQQACEERWLLVFEHDPAIAMGHLRRAEDGKYALEPVKL